MAYELHRLVIPQRTASAVGAGELVVQLGSRFPASALDDTVVPVATFTDDVLGVSRASHAVGEPVDLVYAGIVKCKAGASLGQGARVGLSSGVGSSLGLVPVVFSGTSVPARYAVGRALTSAVVGDIFTVLLDAQQLI